MCIRDRLLDRRDQLLRDLSEYVQIRTSFDKRGSVTVSLSESSTKGRLVSGIKSSSLAIDPVANDRARLEYKLQGELSNEPLTGLPSGSVSGYARFYSETLVKVTGELDTLADVLVDEVNSIQTTGLDGEGSLGQEYFQVVPSFNVDRARRLGTTRSRSRSMIPRATRRARSRSCMTGLVVSGTPQAPTAAPRFQTSRVCLN